MTTIDVTITFNTPFRVAQGHAGGLADETIDRENPLPATSLKGLFRDAARDLASDELVKEVFGARQNQESPWHFSDAQVSIEPQIRIRARVSIDEDRRAEPGALFFGEEAHVTTGRAQIELTRPLPEDKHERHVALLHLAARAVDGIGSDRRRGLGWVNMETNATETELRRFAELIVRKP